MHSPNRRRSLTLAAGLCAVTAWLPALRATTYYVDAANTTTIPAPDGSAGNPWPSFAAIHQSELNGGDLVLINSGSYNEVFTITKGGTSTSARITYKGRGPTMPILYGVNGAGPFKNTPFSFIAVIGLQFTQPNASYGLITSSNPTATNTPGVGLRGSKGWLIQDNYFFQMYGQPIDLHSGTVNEYNIIRGNRFDQIGYVPAMNYFVGNDIIAIYGDHNLVEYNTFGIGEHRIYTYSSQTIIRNNLDTGTNETLFPTSNSPVPGHEHIDDVHGGFALANSLNFASAQNFIDRNFWADNAGLNGHNNIFQDLGFSGSGPTSTGLTVGIVIRQNVGVRTGSAFLETDEGTQHTRIYNNTIVGTLAASTSSGYNATISFFPPANSDIDCRNNIFYDTNPSHLNSSSVLDASNTTGFTDESSDVFANGTLGFGSGNFASNPDFNDAPLDDYTLAPSSPVIRAATALTTTAAAGTGTSLVVNDATGFCDGFGITGGPEGDFIKVGFSSYVQITAVDYSTNTLTLASPLTWNSGDPVIVKGMEDIGALPSEYAVTPTVTNTSQGDLSSLPPGTIINLTATSSTPNAVRRIDFLVDGLPVGSAYQAPYSVPWTADGNNHIVEARAYNAWASETLWVSDFGVSPTPTPTPTPTPSPTPTPTGPPTPTPAPLPPAPGEYFGQIGNSSTASTGIGGVKVNTSAGASIAAILTPSGGGGTLVGYISGINAAFVVNFTLSSGAFSVQTIALSNSGGLGETLTITGQFSGGVLSGTIQPLNSTFAASVDPSTGPSSALAGLYQGTGSLGGSAIFTLVGTQGEVFTLLVSQEVVTAGFGSVTPAGTLSAQALQGVSISGSFSASNSALDSTATLASGSTITSAGLSSEGVPNVSPASQTVSAGSNASFSVDASGTGLTYQWLHNWAPIPGAIEATLSVNNVGAKQTGYYSVVVRGNAGSVTSNTSTLAMNVNAHLVNCSSRAFVGTGSQVLIAGFAVAGTSTMHVLLRAAGPALAGFGVGGALAAPQLTLFDASSASIATNAGWSSGPLAGTSTLNAAVQAATSALFKQVGSFAIPAGSGDDAMLAILPPGTYTAEVAGLGGSTGVALAELYDADTAASTQRLVNISSRAFVGTGSQVLIAGFVVSGSTYETLLVRAVGPTLGQFGVSGVLPNPRLTLFDSGGSVIASNEGWGNPPVPGASPVVASVASATAADISSFGAFALYAGSADSAMVVNVPPGAYTAEVDGVGGTSGVGLVEVYDFR